MSKTFRNPKQKQMKPHEYIGCKVRCIYGVGVVTKVYYAEGEDVGYEITGPHIGYLVIKLDGTIPEGMSKEHKEARKAFCKDGITLQNPRFVKLLE